MIINFKSTPRSKTILTKIEHYNLNEGRVCFRAVALDCITFSKVYLINWQLSACIWCHPDLYVTKASVYYKGISLFLEICIYMVFHKPCETRLHLKSDHLWKVPLKHSTFHRYHNSKCLHQMESIVFSCLFTTFTAYQGLVFRSFRLIWCKL